MVKAIIVDDEPYCCESLATLLKKYCSQVSIADICHSGEQAIQSVQKHNPQILFLDIEMPNMNGFEVLERLPEIPMGLIFTTSFDQYAIKAIRLSALDYLLKPVDREELVIAVQKVTTRLQSHLPQQLEILIERLQSPKIPLIRIALPTMEGLQLISINSILYCTSNSNYSEIHMKERRKLIVTRTLKEMEEMLEDYGFLRVHNSNLVNLNEVDKYFRGEGGYLVMTDGSSVDVSRSKKELLVSKLRQNTY